MKLIITAPRGKMASLIVADAARRDDVEIIAGIGPKGRDYIGKDIGEVVSDLVIDGGKAVINTISDGVSNVVNGIQNTADAIGRGLDQIGSSISALFAW